jgi:hypothetical protein
MIRRECRCRSDVHSRTKARNATAIANDDGDALLIEAGARFRAIARETDCVARLGGDEFVILLAEGHTAAGIDSVCRRIVESFTVAIAHKGADIATTCSIGVAECPNHGEHKTGFRCAPLAALCRAGPGSGAKRQHALPRGRARRRRYCRAPAKRGRPASTERSARRDPICRPGGSKCQIRSRGRAAWHRDALDCASCRSKSGLPDPETSTG